MVKPKLFLGLSGVGVMLTSVLFAGQKVANDKAGLINDALGMSTQKVSKVGDNVEGSSYVDSNGNLCDEGLARLIQDTSKYCVEAVEQGSVLLKNDDCLPLASDKRKVTLFGNGSKNLFMRSGAGGAAPNDELVINLFEGFKKAGFSVNKKVWDSYSSMTTKDLTDPKKSVETETSLKNVVSGTSLKDDVLTSCDEFADAAIVTLVRIGTEDTDPTSGILNLNSYEQTLLKAIKLSGKFEKTIVLINSPMPMSTDWADNEDYGIDAVVYMGVPGYYGATGVANLIAGEKEVDGEKVEVNPSGHCVDTFAANASSSAAYQNFGDASVVVYKEGVYVGYKYYETRYEDCILGQGNADGSAGVYCSKNNSWNYADEVGFPFGFGLSYTTFKEKITEVKYDKDSDEYQVKVEVKNTGTKAGKASVQVYAQIPYTDYDVEYGLGKPSISLMAYDKVYVEPGKTVNVTVPVNKYFLCTYDCNHERSYIIEEGDYYFAVGNGAHEALNNIIAVKNPDKKSELYDHLGKSYEADTDCVYKQNIKVDTNTYKKSVYNDYTVENQFDDADYNYYIDKHGGTKITYLDRGDWQTTWPTVTKTSPANNDDLNMSLKYAPTSEEKASAGNLSDEKGVSYDVDLGEADKINFVDMADVPLKGKVTKGRFKDENGEEVWERFISQMSIKDLAISVSDNRGILTVSKINKIGNSVAEGPEGLLSRFQYGDNRWATGFPTGPIYTGTWDHEMQKKHGGFYGEEAIYAGVACCNAPGANIVRTAYTSRASEYMSEDGILNYYTASNVIKEARRKGLIMNIKHCFLNNQENGRKRVQTYCNEQAIREIYLKPFEGALTRGEGLGIMTSYNRIGAVYSACHKPLMQNVMRGEWGYQGLIIDDAYTGSNTDSYSNGPAMLYCGTDLFCLDGQRGGQLVSYINEKSDMVTVRGLQRANKYVMYALSRSWMGGIEVSDAQIREAENPWWKATISGIVIGTTSLTGACFAAYVVFEVLDKKKYLGA